MSTQPNPHPDTENNTPRLVQFTKFADSTPLPQGWLVRFHPASERWTATYQGMPCVFAESRADADQAVRVKVQQFGPEEAQTPAPEAGAPPEKHRQAGARVWLLGAAALAVLLGGVAGAVLAERFPSEAPVEQTLPEACQQALVAADVLGDTARSVQQARGATDGAQFSYHLAQMEEWEGTLQTARHACDEALGY